MQLSDSGSQFSCLVSNAYGTVLSSNAVLTVGLNTGVMLEAHFENELQGFTIDNTYGSGNGLWHLSTGRAQDAGHSPIHSLYYGHNETSTGGGNYDTGVSGGVVMSPTISLPSAAPITLSFNYLLNVESLTGYDVAYVEVTTNNGASYVTLASKNMFGGLTSPTAGWVSNTVDLTAFAGTTLNLRFRFDTIDGIANATEGWYLDDITITAPPSTPLITAQPQSVSAVVGQTVAFSISASGSAPLSYYWNRNGAPIPGATNASFTANNVQLSDSGAHFSCLVSNVYGTILSSNALLTVNPPPPCTVPPPRIISWWQAESNALDLTSLDNGTPAGGVSYVPGKVGQALSFNGTDAEVSLGTSAGNFGTNDFTIEFWIRRAARAPSKVSWVKGPPAIETAQDFGICESATAGCRWH